MPTCPGCGRTVAYDRVRHHVRACPGVWRVEDREAIWNAHLGAETERVERKLDTLLSALDRLEASEDDDRDRVDGPVRVDDVERRPPE